mmetsp:Transcript_21783/g.32431  ORF Transcript_21783/g.32431 Transcript_21783/m.32431 type:complete len:461 (+) Transcript_21783:81-1463(+)
MFESFYRVSRGQVKSVEFQCDCGAKQPIWNLFFCHHSEKFSCEQCTIKEIDTFFSPSLLISTLSNTAFKDFNRCSKECDCPICGSTLQQKKTVDGKMQRFVCEFCRWDSAEIGLVAEDGAKLLELIRKQEFPHKKEFKRVTEELRSEMNEEKEEFYGESESSLGGEGKKDVRGTFKASLKKIKAFEDKREKLRNLHYKLPPKVEEKDPKPVTDPLEGKIEGYEITSVEQRLSYPGTQPLFVKNLYPRRKRLMTKIAHRCPTSNKFVVKPKIGATHTTFDKCSLAIHVVPKITLDISDSLQKGKQSTIVLYLKSPVSRPMKVTLSANPPLKIDTKESTEESKLKELKQSAETKEEKKKLGVSDVVLPIEEVLIPPFDDITEDIMQLKTVKPKKTKNGTLTFGKLSKVGVPLLVTPSEDHSGNTMFSLGLMLEPLEGKKGTVSRVKFEKFSCVVHFNIGLAE